MSKGTMIPAPDMLFKYAGVTFNSGIFPSISCWRNSGVRRTRWTVHVHFGSLRTILMVSSKNARFLASACSSALRVRDLETSRVANIFLSECFLLILVF